MCGFGHEGPDSSHVTMGPTAQALTGLTFLVGLPDRPPAGWTFSYLDHVGGYLGAVAILTGLAAPRPHGRGPVHRRVAARAGDRLVGRDPPRCARQQPTCPAPTGSRRETAGPPARLPRRRLPGSRGRQVDRDLVPHRGAVAGAGRRPWATRRGASEARFATFADRRQHADELDARIEEWTCGPRPLRGHGAAAGAPASRPASCRTPPTAWSATRNSPPGATSRCSETRRLPRCRSKGVPFRMERTPPRHGGRSTAGPPLLGEDTDTVLEELLGLGGRRDRWRCGPRGCSRERRRPRRSAGARARRRVGRVLRPHCSLASGPTS